MTYLYAIAPIVTLFCVVYLLVRLVTGSCKKTGTAVIRVLFKTRTRERVWCPVHRVDYAVLLERPVQADWTAAAPTRVCECGHFADPRHVVFEQTCLLTHPS